MKPFLRSVVRGLAAVMPPVLTLIILIWAWRTIDEYVLAPIYATTVELSTRAAEDIRTENPGGYERTADGFYIPPHIAQAVREDRHVTDLPPAHEAYRHYAESRWLNRNWFTPVSLCVLIALLYVAGKVGNRGVGRAMRRRVQTAVARVPFVRRVYGAVSQVSQHVFTRKSLKGSTVVAVQYPRPGTWTIGYVIKDGLADVATKSGERMVSVFMDTSPVPMNGYILMVKESEMIPLDITFEDAIRFVMTAGIVVPPSQRVAAE